jgi:imidazolonepropionase-like amidohydrolase/Tol biopolymer transport system component
MTRQPRRLATCSRLCAIGCAALAASLAAAQTQIQAQIDTTQGTWLNVDVSPDGRSIVFDLLGDIFVLPRQGGMAQALTSGAAYDTQPRYSPDGRSIAFVSDRSGQDNIWLVSADGTDFEQITREPYRKPSSPTWTPDGTAIAMRKHFTGSRTVGAGEIWRYDVRTGAAKALVERESDQKDINEPAFTADGKGLFFSRDVWPGDTFPYDRDPHKGIMAIQRLDLTTAAIETIVEGGGGGVRPSPSPDGRWLAYITRHSIDAGGLSSALMVRDLESGAAHVLDPRLDQDAQELWANHGYYPNIAWSPDSASVVYSARGALWETSLADRQPRSIPMRVRASIPLVLPPRAKFTIDSDRFPVKALHGLASSPSGDLIAFRALGHIYWQSLADGEAQRLTNDSAGFETDPTFSPDGEWIVFARWHDQEQGSIRRVNIRTGASVTVTERPGHYRAPVVSPDGSILYRRLGPGMLLDARWTNTVGVYRTPWGTGPEQRVTDDATELQVCRTQLFGVLSRPRPGKPPREAWLFDRVLTNLTGAKPVPLAVATNATSIRISPDCRWVAFIDRGIVRVAKVVTSKGVALALDTSLNFAAPGDGAEFLSWTAGGELRWSLGPQLNQWQFSSTGPVGVPRVNSIGFSGRVATPVGTIALVNVRAITMRRDEVLQNATIVIAGDRIIAVGPAPQVTIPSDAKIVDLQGATVLPGLIDSHWHGVIHQDGTVPQQVWPLQATLALGVTTVFEPAADNQVFTVAEMQRAGRIVSPRIFSTGRTLYGAERDDAPRIESPADAQREVRRRKLQGAIAVKSYLLPRREQRQWVVEAARREGLFVASEAAMATMATISQIVDGETSIEHAMSLANVYDDVVQLWRQADVDTVPTMIIGLGGASGELMFYSESDVWRHPILSRHVPPEFLRATSARRPRVTGADLSVLRSARWLERLRSEGVAVLPGSHGQREGLAMHWEMWLMAAGGTPPHAVLRAATVEAAKHLGLDRDLGSLEPGKLADLIVLDRDPLADIRNTDRIRYIVSGGSLYEAGTLQPLHGKPRANYYWE